ncbi:MarR family transcriptional regulator [Sinosporangium siamense]|nr:MarR family transcriptional regulator [Sinosporangium siamense]
MVEAVSDQARIAAMRSMLFHMGLAAKAGINASDFNCVALLDKEGPMPPQQLAERIGLGRGGAITVMVDRLEMAGYVRRRRHADDRGRVFVELVRGGPYNRLQKIIADVSLAFTELAESYSDAELAVIQDFASRANDVVLGQTLRLGGA